MQYKLSENLADTNNLGRQGLETLKTLVFCLSMHHLLLSIASLDISNILLYTYRFHYSIYVH